MNNSTENFSDEGPPPALAVSFVISGAVALLAAYILVVLIIHLTKLKVKKLLFGSSREKRQATISRLLCLFVAFLTLMRSLSVFGFIKIGYFLTFGDDLSDEQKEEANVTCSAIMFVSDLSLTIGTGSVYVFLWIRQRIFYVYPELEALSNRFVRVFSVVVIIMWFIYYFFAIITYIITVRFVFDPIYVCNPVNEDANNWIGLILISWLIATLLMEVSLMGLFVFPLLKRESWRKKNVKGTGSGSASLLLHRVKKAVILTMVTAVSDILAFIIGFTVGGPLAAGLFNVNMLTNLLAAIGCFDHWRSMLGPWRPEKKSLGSSEGSTVTARRNSSFTATQRFTIRAKNSPVQGVNA